LSHETFSFEKTASAGFLCGSPRSMGSSSSIESFSSSARELASPPVPVRKLARLKESSSSPAILQQFQRVLSIKMDGAMCDDRPGGGLDAAAAAQSPEVVSAAETQTPDSPSSDSKSCRGTSSPMRVPRGVPEDLAQDGAPATDETAAEHLLQDVAPADIRRKEWIASVQKKFGADPHYHVRPPPTPSHHHRHHHHPFTPSKIIAFRSLQSVHPLCVHGDAPCDGAGKKHPD